jgi:hypothetical protein
MALTDWAIYRLSDGYIDNVIWFDAETAKWTPPEGHGMVDIPGDGSLAGEWSMCGIGWSYINGQFIEPKNPNAITQLSVDISAIDLIIPVVNASTFLNAGYLKINNELISFSNIEGNNFIDVVRGVNGTIASDHLSGADVSYLTIAPNQPVAQNVDTL